MNRFTADYSSSLASTPVIPRTRNHNHNVTPEHASTTPLAPPPSQPFGSSQAGTGVRKLGFNQTAHGLPPRSQPNSFGVSATSQSTYPDEDEDEYTDDMEEDEEDERDEIDFHPRYTKPASTQYNLVPPQPQPRSLMKFSTQSSLQDEKQQSQRLSTRIAQYSALPGQGQEGFAPGLARDLRRRLAPAALDNDPDVVIVRAEQLLRNVQEDAQTADDDVLDAILADASKSLEQLWEKSVMPRRRKIGEDLDIGPGLSASPFENARFVAVLILRLLNSPSTGVDEAGILAMPQILLDWLNECHMNLEGPYNQVTNGTPNPASDEYYWDVIEGLTARGKLEEVIRLLNEANFAYAKVDRGIGIVDANYNGTQLQLIRTAVDNTRTLLQQSPAVTDDDWYIDGPSWIAYRKQVESALEDLRELTHMHDDPELMEAELEVGAIRPEKSLPYEVYQRLSAVHNILLGSSEELIFLSNDWLEASVLLTVWWSGETSNAIQQWSFDVSRAQGPDVEDTLGLRPYLTRLKESFLAVTDPRRARFQLNPQSPLELAIALTLQGEMDQVLALLQTYSLNIASTLAEVGSWAGWLSSTPVPEGLDKEDMWLITNGASSASITKDEILEYYANELFKRADLHPTANTVIGGWEIAISVASRCDDRALAGKTIDRYLDELPITNSERAGRLVALCGELEMWEQSRRVSEQYGDHLVNTSADYGTALLCYAQAHAENKVRQLIDLLNSYCLVQSKAYPADSELDSALSQLVSNPKSALASIAEGDAKAVEVLQFYLVGYACLRRYYTTRDNGSSPPAKKQAAKALVAAINSAADSIYGGLYDPERQTAIQVDGLLTLLGEATALTADHNNGTRVFSSDQLYAILAAVEDLETVSDRVYAAAEECFLVSVRQYNGSQPPSPHAMLKKSMSSGTNSNFSFSMMGSEMLANSTESFGARSLGSAVLVDSRRHGTADDGDDISRGWDWRSHVSQDVTGKDVLKYLRLSIAQELSIANLEHP